MLAKGPPSAIVLPSDEIDTAVPCCASAYPPVAESAPPCCCQPLSVSTKTQKAPAELMGICGLAVGLPSTNVFPSADIAREVPSATPVHPGSVPTSLLPCCVQTLSARVNTHTAPLPLLSLDPPSIKVLPSAERVTEVPCREEVFPPRGPPPAPVPTSLIPCCIQPLSVKVNTHTAPALLLSV